MEGGVKGMVNREREASEFQKKLVEVQGKPMQEQIKVLKLFINEQELKNKQLITKQLRVAKEYEKVVKKVQEATNAKPLPPKPVLPQG